ncbi:acyl carrier protein [Chitiniphilus purpureus]|uniref:Acyl carrier protein n=1 Tax=Chitiniphilus purpureus TaxID=2981137 RepID=A0ABY6DSY4_9NEIS|nr:acyl carrier protein [Chitiniphilus sp. CD1]UXY17132.1 acyl carrier protein [Chitiniphilus sp. CD1]
MEDGIQTLVNQLLVEISGTRKTIAPTKHLVEDLGFDSLKMVDLMMAIEERFDVAIPVADATRIRTVSDLYQAIARVANAPFPA